MFGCMSVTLFYCSVTHTPLFFILNKSDCEREGKRRDKAASGVLVDGSWLHAAPAAAAYD
jgi:hypothetical protein